MVSASRLMAWRGCSKGVRAHFRLCAGKADQGAEVSDALFGGPNISLRRPLTTLDTWLICQMKDNENAMQDSFGNLTTRSQYEGRAKVMKALAHPSRLMMIDELSRGERCVCELTDLVGHDISTVSKHLNVLKKAGVVEDDKRGKQVFYRLKVPCILNFFQCFESVVPSD